MSETGSTRQFVKCAFKEGAQAYTYHNDGPPLSVGDKVKLETKHGEASGLVVALLDGPAPKYETRPCRLAPVATPTEPDVKMASAAVFHQIVAAPWAHPAWSHYAVSVVHLRPDEGVIAPNFYFEGATHELLIVALDPRDNKTPLLPVNFAMQAIFYADESAARLGERVAEMILDQRLNPDTDFIRNNAEVCERLACEVLGAARAETNWRDGERG